MGFLEWLGNFVGQLFPPWVIVPKTHVAVRQRNVPLPLIVKRWWPGVVIRHCGPGFVFKIPFIDEVWEVPVTIESDDLDNIEAETKDGLVYDISPVLQWKVSNPIKAAFEVSDYENSLKNEARAIVLKWVNGREGLIDVTVMSAECTELVKKIGSDWGCFVRSMTFNSCARPWEIKELQHSIMMPKQ